MPSEICFGHAGEQALLADLYLPDASGPHPLVIAVPGGGWIRGHRRSLAGWAQLLNRNGIAVATIDYRRADKCPAFPGNVEDVAAAISFFSENSDAHGIDAARIATLGASAGAHLSSLALLSDKFSTPSVKGMALIYGVYDLHAHWQADLTLNAAPGTDKTERMMGATPYDNPQLYHDAAPLRQITYGKAMPVLLCWGNCDRDISPEQSRNFDLALRQAGFQVRSVEFEEAGHFWFSEEDLADPISYSARLAPELVRFFKRILEVSA
ncbi:alpha/beta hydrolase [Rhizobium sp. L1K21]|uniref:alpha/beta hydrolase n=1 Tax=Rhizobium sp. L1K21 TaxID=2954933 RepID=UPI002092511C|nr:alpha/beta hydrolase [Rhizobium sp. L1K21]MCO6188439.1 alpha/beta hydrolase [Rhizobium sp. L1K21]